MLEILSVTTPIYVLIGVGFLTTRWGLFNRDDMRVFGRFVLNIALPAMLFRTVSQRSIGEILNPTYLLAYLAGTFVVIFAGFFWSRRVVGLNRSSSTVCAMGMACSNSGYVGYPILLLILAQIAGVALALNLIVENLVVIPSLLLMLEPRQDGAGRWEVVAKSLLRVAGNPLIIALFCGVAMSLLGWRLPTPLERSVDMVSATTSGIALFVIGGMLVGLSLRGTGSRVASVAIGKLIAHPLAVFAAMATLPLFGMAPVASDLYMAGVLMAAMPMMGVYPTLALAYGEEGIAAPALLATTIASFFTLSAWLWLFKHTAILA
ncbi:AEC family transporter [Propionivibrio soli]|uniref:AEC family transporter n=1 Tax=Propionivibrio soli TaxID=2976531 RepID=UPI0021E83630|nr:AEC family transporter [Propionivibrio soli]